MAFRAIAATLIMLVGFSDPGYATRDTGISEEVRKTLAETHFERPPSFDQRQDLVKRLQRRGIETITDLHPYLGQSENIRYNTLIAIEQMGNIDGRTLGLMEDLVHEARDPSAPSVALAVRLVLYNSEPPEAVRSGLAIAPKSQRSSLLVIMIWISQHYLSFGDSGEARALTRGCLGRMASLFQVGTYSGRQAVSFSIVVEQPPFDDDSYVEGVAGAFLTALRNAGRMTDMEKLGFISAFAAVARGAEVKPQFVEDGLVRTISMGSDPLVKLILWRMSIEGFADTTSGKRIVAMALKKSPGLAGYVDQLRRMGQGMAGMDADLKSEIERAFLELRMAPGGLMDSTSIHPDLNRS